MSNSRNIDPEASNKQLTTVRNNGCHLGLTTKLTCKKHTMVVGWVKAVGGDAMIVLDTLAAAHLERANQNDISSSTKQCKA